MNKIIFPLSVTAALIGIALTTRTEISFSLPVGMFFIISAGVLLFVHFKLWADNSGIERAHLLEELQELNKSIKYVVEIDKQSKAVDKTVSKINEQIITLCSAFDDLNKSLNKIQKTLGSNETSILEEQKQLYDEIYGSIKDGIVDIIAKMLEEFNENQKDNADYYKQQIDSSLRRLQTNFNNIQDALGDFSTQNAEVMQKATEGFENFKTILDETVKKLTDMSANDIEMLDRLVNGKK